MGAAGRALLALMAAALAITATAQSMGGMPGMGGTGPPKEKPRLVDIPYIQCQARGRLWAEPGAE